MWTPQSQQRARATLPTVGYEQACGQLREGTKGWPGIPSPLFSADSYLRWLSQLPWKEAEAGGWNLSSPPLIRQSLNPGMLGTRMDGVQLIRSLVLCFIVNLTQPRVTYKKQPLGKNCFY